MRELWGTFSVRDHLGERPFVADVMLYDRLVVPVPPDSAEWTRWEDQQRWDPAKQKRVLDVIRRQEEKAREELVLRIPWDESRRRAFTDKFMAAQAAGIEKDGYRWTAGQLLRDEDVTRAAKAGGIAARVVAAYVSRDALQEDAVVEEITEEQSRADRAQKDRLSIAVGRSFLTPDVEGYPSEERDLELLERAARLATKRSFRQKRAVYNEWVERVVRDRFTTREAVVQMNDLLQEYDDEVRRELIGTRIEQAFMVVGTAVGVAGFFFPPISIGSTLRVPASYLIGRKYKIPATPDHPASMFHEARHELSLGPP